MHLYATRKYLSRHPDVHSPVELRTVRGMGYVPEFIHELDCIPLMGPTSSRTGRTLAIRRSFWLVVLEDHASLARIRAVSDVMTASIRQKLSAPVPGI